MFSLGKALAGLVIVLVVVALVFGAQAPAWLPLVLIGCVALAVILVNYVPGRTITPG